MTRQLALRIDGHCHGPLFAPSVKQRPPKPHNGPERVRQVRSRVPAWADRGAIRRVYQARDQLTRETGVQYSVDHVVPVNHPLVCGLHVAHNLEVVPLLANVRKSNNWWPDMWGAQLELEL
jgi:hypothetical protein